MSRNSNLALANQLLGVAGSVGDVDVRPYYPGYSNAQYQQPAPAVGLMVSPRYVGAPIQVVSQSQPLQAAVQVTPTQYVAADTTWFGLGSTAIAASSVGQDVELKPLRPFTPQREYHPSTIQDLLVKAASIGGTNIFSNVAGVPVELFSEVSTSPQIDWPTIEPSVGIIFTVQNLVASIQPFRGALYGTAARR